MAFHRCGEVVIHAQHLGDPGRPLIVFANSLGTDLRIWSEVVPGLLDRYSVLLYDLRGHGLSEATPEGYGIGGLADDLLALLDSVGAKRFGLVGLSVGGMVAQVVAARYPDKVEALVLCDTAAKIGEAASWQARIDAVRATGLDGIADAILERWFTPAYRDENPVAMRGWRTMLVRESPEGYAATCAAIRDADLRSQAARITAPTLCLVGDQDLATSPDLVRTTADLVPGARFALIGSAGHIPCVEQPRALKDAIRRHLDAHPFA